MLIVSGLFFRADHFDQVAFAIFYVRPFVDIKVDHGKRSAL